MPACSLSVFRRLNQLTLSDLRLIWCRWNRSHFSLLIYRPVSKTRLLDETYPTVFVSIKDLRGHRWGVSHFLPHLLLQVSASCDVHSKVLDLLGIQEVQNLRLMLLHLKKQRWKIMNLWQLTKNSDFSSFFKTCDKNN